MSIIRLQTYIKAPIEVCFDLSRSIELHTISTAHTNEVAVTGKTSGLCAVGDTITWKAKHFGISQHLTVRITECAFPSYFQDEMVSGAFKSFVHRHYFKTVNDNTLMEDEFDYKVPFGIIGRWFDQFILCKYMSDLLTKRNRTIKQYAESDQWRNVLPGTRMFPES